MIQQLLTTITGRDQKFKIISDSDNSRSIAKALTVLLPEYNLKREDLFITSKIPTFIPHWPDLPSLADCKNGLEVKRYIKDILSTLYPANSD